MEIGRNVKNGIVSNQVLVSGLCYLYYCLILYFLGIVELTNYCFVKCILIFFHSTFGSVSELHNIKDPISESKDQFRITSSEMKLAISRPDFTK